MAEFSAYGGAETGVGWHRRGFQALLGVEESTPKRSSRDGDGDPRSDSADEPRETALGAPRIHGELLKRGLTVSQATGQSTCSGLGGRRHRRGERS